MPSFAATAIPIDDVPETCRVNVIADPDRVGSLRLAFDLPQGQHVEASLDSDEIVQLCGELALALEARRLR